MSLLERKTRFIEFWTKYLIKKKKKKEKKIAVLMDYFRAALETSTTKFSVLFQIGINKIERIKK